MVNLYFFLDFPQHFRNLWNDRQMSPDFFVPPPNEFICSNFDIVHKPPVGRSTTTNVISLPERIYVDNMELWYKLDEKYLLPHGFISCYLLSPKSYKSARNIVLTSLYSMTVKHYLTEKLYPALCAGLGYSISAAEKGLLIKLSGYNEKLPLLLDIIAKELSEIASQIEPSVFETYREQCKRNGYNNLINSKFVNRDCRLTIVEEQHHFSFAQYYETEKITFDDLLSFAKSFTQELKVKMMVLGNFEKSEAVDIARTFKENLKYTTIDDPLSRARKIPSDRQHVLYIKSPLPNDKNSTITNYYQIGESTIQTQCLIELVEKIMEEPIFNLLRTKEQLGYAVSCSHRANNGILGFSVTLQVQEEKHSTVAVNERIEKFLREDFQSVIANLTDEEFDTVQSSLIKLKKMDEVEMETENNRLWSEITSDEYLFTRFDMEAEMIGRLKKQQVSDFFVNVLLNSPKLSIQVIGNKGSELDAEDTGVGMPIMNILKNQTENENDHVIVDVIEFTNQLQMFDACRTVVDL
jgi:nardilysin